MEKVKKIQIASIEENVVIESIYDIFGDIMGRTIKCECDRKEIVLPHCCHHNSWVLVILLAQYGFCAQAVEGSYLSDDGSKIKHVFNRVKIDGVWRYFDITMDVLWGDINKGEPVVNRYYALRGLNKMTIEKLYAKYHGAWFTCLGTDGAPAFDDNGNVIVGDFAFKRFANRHPFLLDLDIEGTPLAMRA